jgi:hypothetical protein
MPACELLRSAIKDGVSVLVWLGTFLSINSAHCDSVCCADNSIHSTTASCKAGASRVAHHRRGGGHSTASCQADVGAVSRLPVFNCERVRSIHSF